MNESIRACVSGRFTLKSLRPLTLSKEDTWGDVGDVVGDDEGDILVFNLVVRVRRIAMLIVDCQCWYVRVQLGMNTLGEDK